MVKKIGSMSVFAFAMLAFSACDDSSSASSDETDASSSSVESSDSDDSSSSVSEKSSSSDVKYSSSVKDNPISVDSKSSSSVKSSSSISVGSSSSSKKTESSSSVGSSSSKIQSSSSERSSSSSIASSSSSVKSSSSSVKSSSSVVSSSSKDVASSSSEYVPYDHLIDMGDGVGTHVKKQDYKTFTDERNDRSYYYITIRGKNSKKEVDSVTVMAENLNIGKMIGSGLDQANDTLIERYCYDRDTTNCDRYGGLYQWAEMMQLPSRCNTESCAGLIQENHQGICPDGWRLLTQEDFYIVLHADGNTHGIAGVRSSYGFNGFNSTGYSLVGAGYVWNRKLTRIGEATYWYYPEEGSYSEDGEVISTAFVASTSRSGEYLSEQETLKTQGLSVRCVKMD